MNFIHEYSLLIAIAIPVLVIVGIQALLAIGGERGTLLLPSARPFQTGSGAVAINVEPAPAPATILAAANDEHERKAA